MKQLFFFRQFVRLLRRFLSSVHGSSFQKIVSALVLVAMIGGQLSGLPIAGAAEQGVAAEQSTADSSLSGNVARAANSKITLAEKPNDPNVVYDLVVLVVDTDLDKDNTSYDGLKAAYPEFAGKLTKNKLGDRVLRYAEDIICPEALDCDDGANAGNELTDVKILFYDKQKDSVLTLANALENLSRNGDGKHKNRLSGVVLVGDIPLPVVNKNGNRYISLFPYTDFSDKAYVFNEKNKSFERNNQVAFPKPEIWHGVMRAPTNDNIGRQKLAEFFDKNHLYYLGEPMFAKFDRKMFFADLVHEEEQLNPDIYKQYVKYLASLEDLAYFRYNKFWAAELMSQSMQVLEKIPDEIRVKGGFADSIKDSNPLASLPDIYARVAIEQNLPPYYRVLSKYLGRVNDWSDYTARYVKGKDGSLNMDSVAGLIAVKDEYTKFYLKSVNGALEKKTNEILQKIQEPIKLVDVSGISVEIGDTGTVPDAADEDLPTACSDSQDNDSDGFIDLKDIGCENADDKDEVNKQQLYYRFHYLNEEDGKFYVNGIDANILNSPSQCFPLLGSTKSEYFDGQTLDFNPKAAGGKYSILTRSLRSDDLSTAVALHTVGVNTRMLSTSSIGAEDSELFAATNKSYAGTVGSDGIHATGAIVEDRPEYGISAFIHNPLYAETDPNPSELSYKGPVESELQKGDVIVRVNGRNISYANTFDQAVENSYAAVKTVIDAVNKGQVPQLSSFPYPIKVNPGSNLTQGKIEQAVGYFSLEFYRKDPLLSKATLLKKYFSFTVKDVNGKGVLGRGQPKGSPEYQGPEGGPEVYVLLDTPPDKDFNNPDIYEKPSQGAIFTLYDNKEQGYGIAEPFDVGGRPYDASAGCNQTSTSKNGDRCFGMIASMPVLDVAGSLAPVKTGNSGSGYELKFPEKVKRDNNGQNSKNSADYKNHVDSYQFPVDKKYEDVDEVYYNACFSGLPTTAATPENDSNPYGFPLDYATNEDSGPYVPGDDVAMDWYGRLLQSLGNFAAGPLADESDYVEGNAPANSSDYNAKEKIWLGVNELDAEGIILHEEPKVTLKNFSDRYGLFDGRDNDGDGLADYEWRDNDEDGVYETKFYDFDEASDNYAIDSGSLDEIARKLLAGNSSYTVPYATESFPYSNFDQDITLKVSANVYKEISSLILHNEPTDFTISEQVKSQTAFSLPIDNPRYAALQTVPKPGPVYPEPKPKDQYVKVQEILSKLGNTKAHYYPGEVQKVNYVNLFDPEIKNVPQLKVAVDAKALEIAKLPGSYRIFDTIDEKAKEGEYTIKEIYDEIRVNNLLPVVEGGLDKPIQGFNLEQAAEPKIHDAFRWLALNIDEKHEYVLRAYLNGDAKNQGNAYVNDATLLPAPAGYDPAYGYEAAYLVLNGEGDYFDMNFNKDLPEENDGRFDPLSQVLESGGSGEEEDDGSGGGGSGGEDDEDYQFVWIQDFIKEITKFVNALTSVPEFAAQCGEFFEYFKDAGGKVAEGAGAQSEGESVIAPDSKANIVLINSYVYSEIAGFDELLSAIEQQDLKDGEGGPAGAEDGALTTDDGSGSENVDGREDDNVDGGGNGFVENSGGVGPNRDGSGADSQDGVQASGSREGEAGDSDAAETPSSGSSDTTSLGDDDQVAKNLKNILSGSGGGQNGSSDKAGGQNSIGNSEGVSTENSAGNSSNDSRNLEILESRPVEEVVLNSNSLDGVAGESPGGVERDLVDESENSEVEGSAIKESGTADGIQPEKSPELPWEEYFMANRYFEKFLNKTRPEGSNGRLLAATFFDNPFEKSEQNDYSKYLVEDGDSMVADGESMMKIEAQIFNKNGGLEIKAVNKVRFSLSNNLASLVGSNVVESRNGTAEIYVKAGKISGNFKIKAEVLKSDQVSVNTAYQIVEKELYLVAGEPAKVEISADSYLLVANNQSRITVNIILRDKFGNIANNSFSPVAIFADSIINLDEKQDLDGGILGVQLGTFEGRAAIDLMSTDKAGEANVVAVLLDPELEQELLESDNSWENVDFNKYIAASEKFDVLDKVGISAKFYDENFQQIGSEPVTIPADSKSIIHIGAKLLHDGQIVKDYSGPITFKILKENLSSFVNKPVEKMVNGELNPANVTLRSTQLAGEQEILIEIPGFVSDSFKFRTGAGKADRIELTASENSIQTGTQDNEVILQARLLDENGNLVQGDNGTPVEFKATESTKDLVVFETGKALTLNGVASLKIKGKNVSGLVNIIAGSDGLKTGKISLKIQKHINQATAEGFAPRALYISLLGGAFGELDGGAGGVPGGSSNLAQTLWSSDGQVQAVSSITASTNKNKRLFLVDGNGKIEFLTDTVRAKVVPATDSFPYQKIIMSEDVSNHELASVFVVPKTDATVALVGAGAEIPDTDGIYVKILNEALDGSKNSSGDTGMDLFKTKNDGIYLENANGVKARIDRYGRIFLNDSSYKLRVPTKDDDPEYAGHDGFTLILSKGAADLALINYRQNFNQEVKELAFDSGLKNFFPGVYIQPAAATKKYQFESALSGYSSDESGGVYLVDTEENIAAEQAPGFGYSSLENAGAESGVGFEGNNKHMLLFAAGNSVGQSLIPYASDAGIVYGDPLIRLKIDSDLISKDTGYTKDLGKAVFSGQEPIQQMVEFDVNGDGYDDLLLIYEDGLIRLLENEISNQRFRDRGYILNIYNGIFAITRIDEDNDGYDDLVIGTKESCNAGEQCLSLIKNTNGELNRQSLNLALNDKKAYEIKAGDMNADGCEDLVTSDSSGDISIFYNKTDGKSCLGLNTNHGVSRSFGYIIKDDLNQIESVFVNYPGMEVPDNGKSEDSNWYKFIQFSLPDNQPPAQIAAPAEPAFNSAKYAQDSAALQKAVASNPGVASKDLPTQTFSKTFDFIHVKQDGRLALNSTKQAKDLNGGSLAVGDEIEYLIALKNTSGSPINNLMLTDATPTSMTLIRESLKCLDAGCQDKPEWIATGTSLRSHIIKNISVPSNGQRIISYTMRVEMVPKVHFDIGNDFIKYPSNNNDAYLDIMVRPEINPDGVLSYLYSTGPQSYAKIEVSPADGSENVLDKTFEKMGLPSPSDLLKSDSNELPPDIQSGLSGLAGKQAQDTDYNGCADSWNGVLTNLQTGGDAVASAVEGVLSNLRCSGGGCAPIPYNMAFLTPDTPAAGVPGFPVVNILSSPPYFVPLGPSTNPASVFRLYVSPTLTLGLGMAACAGPGLGGASPCFAFAVPGGIPGSSSVCDLLESGIDKAMTAAKSALVDTEIGQSAVITDGDEIGGADAVTTGGSWNDESDPISASSKVNIKIPGFPSVITNWMDNQIDEIYTKLLDFPTFYFVLPDFGRVGKESKLAARNFSFRSFNDFAASISSFPFVKLESKEIVMKIPAISAKELEKYKYQAKAWVKHMENELEKYKLWNCEESADRKALCDKVLLDIQNLISSVKQTMDALDQIANLPKDILTWRNMEAKYATQIICYLDAVMNYTGGYINRQEKIIKSWIKTIQDTIETFKQWKLIMDVVAEYQQSCDRCTSDRTSKLGLLMQLFAVVPEPPVIPLPKWPDFVVDFSQIKTGVTILWPDVVFRPQPIILPNLPTIVLPDVLPVDFKLDLSDPDFSFKLDLPKFEKFTMPNLPDLPPIPLPQLPDLPKPPRIPALPNAVGKLMTNLKFIFKILCLLKNGYLTIPESFLGTQIETLTQPSVNAVLPLIKNLGLQYPPIEYSYVDQIRITGKLNFDIDTNMIYLLAEKGAEEWNENVKEFVKNINKYLALPYGQWLNNLIQASIDKAYKEAADAIKEKAEKAKEELKKEGNLPLADGPGVDFNSVTRYGTSAGKISNGGELLLPDLEAFKLEMEEINAELNDYVAMVKKEQASTPEIYRLIAGQTFLDPDDPLLNRSLAEIEAGISRENLPDAPGISKLADLRNGLIAYTKGLNSANAVLEDVRDIDEFTKILVENDQSLSRIAQANTADDAGGDAGAGDAGAGSDADGSAGAGGNNQTLELSFLGQENEAAITSAADDAALRKKRDLIAAAIDFNPQDLASGGGQSAPPPVGFFVGAGDINENVLNYTPELKNQTNILFNDVDHDNDYDIVFSMGGDVYLKTSHKNTPALPVGELLVAYTGNSVSEYYMDAGDSVQGVEVPYTNSGKAEISWLAKGDDTVAYEVILRKSIYDEYKNAAHTYRVEVAELTDKSAPTLEVEIPNGNYYVNVFALNGNGAHSLASDTVVVAPQSCADTDPPFPVLAKTDYDISIFKDVEIDASASFDADGAVNKYYLEVLPYETKKTDPNTKAPLKTTQFQKIIWSDLSVLVDDDGDGTAWNDRNNPRFKIGPFVNEGDIGIHEFILHVADQSGREASLKIRVNVFAPAITLSESFARTALASGDTNPKTGKLPFWLMRNRYIFRVINGELKLAPRMDKIKEAQTDDNGGYELNDFELEDMILVEDANGEVVAEINPKTGDVGKLKDGYRTVVHAGVPPNYSTNITIVTPNGQVLGTVYLVANANVDVAVHYEFSFNAGNSGTLSGVHVDDTDTKDDFEFVKLAGNDPGNPGGVILRYKPANKVLVSIDTAGNIVVLDPAVKLKQKTNDHEKDPLIVEISFEGKKVAEVFVAPVNDGLIVGPGDVPYANPGVPSEAVLKGSTGVNVPDDLDFIFDTDFKFSQQDPVKRKDFVKVLLRMICIVPREEAHKPFKAGTGYADNQNLGAYHPDIKEATLLGFVEGYKGEPDSASGLFPFKPENTVNRAEATKIILKALEFRGVVDLSAISEGIPWHAYYMKAAMDLTPYLKTGMIPKNNFIITPQEALDPYKTMTFGELITMIERVLEIYNCFQNDNDKDGMSDFCEAKYQINDPQADHDYDGLNNKFECAYKLDPTDEDSDNGGVRDGQEIDLRTNPLDPADDTIDEDNDGLTNLAETTIYGSDPFNPDTDGGGKSDGQEVKDCTGPLDSVDDDEGPSCNEDNEPGLYILPAECNACPCASTFLHRAEIIPGDVFFPVVGVYYQKYYENKPEDKSYIFSKGNEVTVQTVK